MIEDSGIYSLKVEGLTLRLPGGVTPCREVSFQVRKGERVAIIGASGAGKTSLFRQLNLTIAPTSGTIYFDGVDTSLLKGRRLWETRRKIGTIYQQHNLVQQLLVVHNVLSGQLGTQSFFSSVSSLFMPLNAEKAYAALKQVGISQKIYTRTDKLSGGEQQRVAIARVLVQNPDLILADEPISSLDPVTGWNIIKLLVDINEMYGKMLLVNLHNVYLAVRLFPRILGIKSGRIVFDVTPQGLTSELLKELYEELSHSGGGEDVPHYHRSYIEGKS